MYDDYVFEHYNFPAEKQQKRSKESSLFLTVVVALVGLGLVTLFSASYNEGIVKGVGPLYFTVRQLLFALMGFFLFFIVKVIPLSFIKKMIPLFFVFSLVLMLLTLVGPFGAERMGAKRWLEIGPLPSFQPSEVLKVSVILMLALLYSSEAKQSRKTVLSVVIVAVSALLILLQKDYSTTLIFLLVALAMLLIGEVQFRYIALFVTALIIPTTLFLLYEPYRIRRVVSFLLPSIDPTGLNWQVQNSLKAISSAHFFGKGLGGGLYKLGILPEVQNDFIFASFVEEGGFIAVLLFFTLFALFGFIGFKVALRAYKEREMFISYLSFGLTFMIIWQTLTNIGVTISLLPPTGIPLPFFSQGGTSLFMTLFECGLLYKCIDQRRSFNG